MTRIFALSASTLLFAVASMADVRPFTGLAAAAGKVEAGASSLSADLKKKSFKPDPAEVKTRIEALGQELSALKSTVEELDREAAASLEGKQRQEWEKIKLRVHIMGVFHEQKSELASGDMDANRSQIERAAHGIAIRARALKQEAGKL